LFACAVANVNASARIMFRMGRHGFLHNKFGASHQQNETPHYATTVSSVLMFSISAVLVLMGISAFDIISTMGTIATFGFLLVYILISIAAPVYMRSLRELRVAHILVAIASILFLLIPAVAAFYPIPAAPADKFPLYFGAYMLVGIVWCVWLNSKSPEVVERIRQDLKTR
jgi:amino acid transporter